MAYSGALYPTDASICGGGSDTCTPTHQSLQYTRTHHHNTLMHLYIYIYVYVYIPVKLKQVRRDLQIHNPRVVDWAHHPVGYFQSWSYGAQLLVSIFHASTCTTTIATQTSSWNSMGRIFKKPMIIFFFSFYTFDEVSSPHHSPSYMTHERSLNYKHVCPRGKKSCGRILWLKLPISHNHQKTWKWIESFSHNW
jgi:hypothetical protein